MLTCAIVHLVKTTSAQPNGGIFLVRDESVFSQAMKIGYAQDVLAAAQKLRKNVK